MKTVMTDEIVVELTKYRRKKNRLNTSINTTQNLDRRKNAKRVIGDNNMPNPQKRT